MGRHYHVGLVRGYEHTLPTDIASLYQSEDFRSLCKADPARAGVASLAADDFAEEWLTPESFALLKFLLSTQANEDGPFVPAFGRAYRLTHFPAGHWRADAYLGEWRLEWRQSSRSAALLSATTDWSFAFVPLLALHRDSRHARRRKTLV